MLVHEDSLPDVYQHALKERGLGKRWIYVELEPTHPTKRFITLWEGSVGEVIGRTYYSDDIDGPGGSVVTQTSVKGVRVRVNVVEVIEAYRRYKKRAAQDFRADIPANRVAPKSGANTSR